MSKHAVQYGKLALTYQATSGQPQKAQVEMGEGITRDHLHHIQPYGFSSRPKKDAEAITLAISGDESKLVAITLSDRRYTLALEEGEAALHDDQGQVVYLKREGILIKTSKKITLDAPESHFTGKVYIPDDAIIGGKSFNGHYHEISGRPTTNPKG